MIYLLKKKKLELEKELEEINKRFIIENTINNYLLKPNNIGFFDDLINNFSCITYEDYKKFKNYNLKKMIKLYTKVEYINFKYIITEDIKKLEFIKFFLIPSLQKNIIYKNEFFLYEFTKIGECIIDNLVYYIINDNNITRNEIESSFIKQFLEFNNESFKNFNTLYDIDIIYDKSRKNKLNFNYL